MKRMTLGFIGLVLLTGVFIPSGAQEEETINASRLSGIRIGGTYIWSNDGPNGKEEAQVMINNEINSRYVTEFGWHFEKQFGVLDKGAAGVVSLLVLGGGFNQGKIIPSVTGLMGFRLKNGFEFGGGPNAILSRELSDRYTVKPGFAWATGYSARVGRLVLPLNAVAVQSASGLRLTILSGIIW